MADLGELGRVGASGLQRRLVAAPKEGNMKTVYSALVAFSAVMLVVSSANPANAALKRSYAECRDLANERGFSPGNGRVLGRRGRFVHECRHGRQD